jgi:ABC-type polar amino acid transport system ATPase subunit
MQDKHFDVMRSIDIITADGISKTFSNGIVALSDFTTHIRRSEVVVLIGPSGSGKSTFLRCLNGLESIDSGSIVVDGIALDDNKKNRLEIRKEVGMVFQQFNLFPHMTVRDNIIWPSNWSGKKPKQRPRK